MIRLTSFIRNKNNTWHIAFVLIIYKCKNKKQRRKIQNNSKESTLLVCAKSAYKREIIKEDKQKRIDYIANRRKEKLLFTG